ncbi:MAG TPA: hypothetical protein VHD84_01540 [Candidatus Saccharimonadales bacterium]|nr:hypothetical protein [Candidatus Saccharimonadales bacterium]
MSAKGVFLDCNPEEAWQYRLDRRANDIAVSQYDLPQLPDDPSEFYERLVEIEQKLIPNDDYQLGSAAGPNELLTISGTGRSLLTAEHATDHWRIGKGAAVRRKSADYGTGGLALMFALEADASTIIPVGRQTGDANFNPEHPVKEAMSEIIRQPFITAHLSIHGLARALADHPRAERGYSVIFGIGHSPSDATNTLVNDYLLEAAKDCDLIAGINVGHMVFDMQNHRPALNDDGTVKTTSFKAAGTNTTRSFAQKMAREAGKEDSFAAVQIELSDALRYQPAPDWFPSKQDRDLGAYLGYVFMAKAVESVDKL